MMARLPLQYGLSPHEETSDVKEACGGHGVDLWDPEYVNDGAQALNKVDGRVMGVADALRAPRGARGPGKGEGNLQSGAFNVYI